MIDLPLAQMSGAVAGGIVGGFSGFIANFLQEQKRQRQTRRNVAAALTGEIEALCEYLQKGYLSKLRPEPQNITDDVSEIGSEHRYYYEICNPNRTDAARGLHGARQRGHAIAGAASATLRLRE